MVALKLADHVVTMATELHERGGVELRLRPTLAPERVAEAQQLLEQTYRRMFGADATVESTTKDGEDTVIVYSAAKPQNGHPQE